MICAMGARKRKPGAGRKGFLKDPIRVTADFDGKEIERLRQRAERRGVPVAALLREAVKAYLRRK